MFISYPKNENHKLLNSKFRVQLVKITLMMGLIITK